jgi:predicted alpha/beta hydrolase family esterase
MAEEAELVQRLAREKNVNPPYILVAQHIGCYTAIAYAMKFAKEVTAIVLIQPPPLSAYAMPIPKNYEKISKKYSFYCFCAYNTRIFECKK